MRADSMATDLCRRVSGFTAPRAVAVQNLGNFALDIMSLVTTGVEAATIGLSVFRSLRSRPTCGGCLAPPPHI